MEPVSLEGVPENTLLLIDSAPIIYVLEDHPELAKAFRPVLEADPRAPLANWWKGRDSNCPAKDLKTQDIRSIDRISAPSGTPTGIGLEVLLVAEQLTIPLRKEEGPFLPPGMSAPVSSLPSEQFRAVPSCTRWLKLPASSDRRPNPLLQALQAS